MYGETFRHQGLHCVKQIELESSDQLEDDFAKLDEGNDLTKAVILSVTEY